MADTPRVYPGLDVCGADDADLVLAEVDDYSPTALEERVDTSGPVVRLFFSDAADRDGARRHLAGQRPSWVSRAVDVPDERWAERSQAALRRVTVGALTVAPPWDQPADGSLVITILPSMGFGTGHHASTRLCLALLQESDWTGRSACDVGTGSGVLALAAARLGARPVIAVDYDADAITSARESAELNGMIDDVDIRLVDLERDPAVPGAPFDLVIANLTGGLLTRVCAHLLALVHAGGQLILSGITADESTMVRSAFQAAGCTVLSVREEDGWVGLRLGR